MNHAIKIIRPADDDDQCFVRRIAPRLVAPVRGRPILRVRPFDDDEPARVIFIRPRMPDRARRYGAARGLYRVFNAAGYRFYRSNSAPPAETDSPYATNATLPFHPSTLFADGTWYISASYFNGVIDSGFLPLGPHGETYARLEISGGNQVPTRPSQPLGANLIVRAGGVIRIVAFYPSVADAANAATTWAIAYTTDGSTPASGSPSLTPSLSTGPLAVLVYDLPAQANGTTVKVQLQTYNGTVYSLPLAVMTAVASTVGPSAPLGGGEG